MLAYKVFRVDSETGLLLPATPVGEVVKRKVTGSRFYRPGGTYRTRKYPYMGFTDVESARQFAIENCHWNGPFGEWDYVMTNDIEHYARVFAIDVANAKEVCCGLPFGPHDALNIIKAFNRDDIYESLSNLTSERIHGIIGRICFTKFTILDEVTE